MMTFQVTIRSLLGEVTFVDEGEFEAGLPVEVRGVKGPEDKGVNGVLSSYSK